MATRALEVQEYKQVIELLQGGFTHDGGKFRPNRQVAFALQLQANLGLRIGDVLGLRVSNFRNGKLEQKEEKTGKLQYRDINPVVYASVLEFARAENLSPTAQLFTITVRAVQKQLAIATGYMGLENIGTHSFRKMYATHVYQQSNGDLHLLKELLNHSSIATTQRYIRTTQEAINKASASVNFMGDNDGEGNI